MGEYFITLRTLELLAEFIDRGKSGKARSRQKGGGLLAPQQAAICQSLRAVRRPGRTARSLMLRPQDPTIQLLSSLLQNQLKTLNLGKKLLQRV